MAKITSSRRRGESGEPGRPGEPGILGGGHGGEGGRGGRGGYGGYNGMGKLLALMFLYGAISVAVLSFVAVTNSRKIERNQRAVNAEHRLLEAERERVRVEVLKASRAADTRICSRQNLVRAELQVRNPELKRLAILRRRVPILNCDPNLRGEPAVPLSNMEQKLYVDLYNNDEIDAVTGFPRSRRFVNP